MKKTFSNIRTLAALLMAGAAFAACSNSDDIINEQPVNNTDKQGYTLTISASKDGSATRALDLDGSAVVASWETTDEIVVTKNGTEVGTLSPTNISGLDATFSGTIDGEFATSDVLTLSYHPIDGLSGFASQDGTLNGLATSAENFDMAVATVTISEINGKNIIVSEPSANFVNQTAVVVFTPSRRAPWGDVQYFNISSLTILATMNIPNVGAVTEQIGTITVSGDYPYYFSLPSQSLLAEVLAEKYSLSASAISTLLASATISFAGFIGQLPYNPSYLVCSKTGYKFAAGKYYKLDVSNFAMDILMKATVDGKDVYYDGSQSYWSNTVTLPINSVAGWKVEGNYNYVFCGDKQLYMENTNEGTEDWVRAFDGFMSHDATYSLRVPAGDPVLSTLTISGHTFSYQAGAGETWEKAIKYYPVENAGWTIYKGTWDLVRYGDLQLYDHYGNEIKAWDTIDPNEAYYLPAPAGPVTYTELKNGDVLHVGDIINSSEEICIEDIWVYMGPSDSYTVLRADLTFDAWENIQAVNEKADGHYYVIKSNTGAYITFGGDHFPVTSTSDGILVTFTSEYIGTSSRYKNYKFSVHEP